MSFIDKTYFIGEISLPNTTANQERINIFIEEYEEKILVDALGYTLYSELIANYNPANNDKWKQLVEGETYNVEYNNTTHTIKWNGFKNDDKRSFLAYFIYYYYVIDTINAMTGVGIVRNSSENSTIVKPSQKLINAYNKGVEIYGYSGYDDGKILTFDDVSTINNPNILKPSLYNYIIAKNNEDPTTYENWLFTSKKKINLFDL